MTTTVVQDFVCETCGKGPFKNYTGLASHIRFKHEGVEPPQSEEEVDPRIAELEAELKEALTRAAEAEAEAEAFKPTRDVSSFILTDEESVVARFGEQKLRDLAQHELSSVNRRRAKENLPPIVYSDEEREAAIGRVVNDLLNDRTANGAKTSGPIMKTIKMMTPDGHLIQPPFEAQINNQAGSLEDAIAIYRRKDYKIAVDEEGRTLCPSQDCWNSAIVENGEYTFGGYCSSDHQLRTEGNSRPVDRSNYPRMG